ncbi:peptide chain release factor N(5)-glutamine methyltransferase [Luteimonas sp. MC1825]|uniref:peptide chain release factor N(5)-glutamine methyltransferase n=1 Tax=Luteimonas sp. MC1825 TaxID=2761107 RepID=UPI0016215DFD|nr:peptide chain release factor N(5)-glutamine methyltransferase [Luteimonas sp. MC1825]MBB6599880.1 peptide chain release factor N(5)-glutamine methyltransferase [Luteimonas sp. MC1825]QOC87593.1 peptide chain release factor N(5)-glutamine methyltransferase [Luteimonas sp. MC1825]
MTGSRTADEALRASRTRIDPDDALTLLLHVLGRSHGWLYAHGDTPLAGDDAARLDALVARRAAGEPVAYLVGRRGFWSLDLVVTPDTLIPRPETELLVEQALARIPPATATRVADLGTGSGAIALAIASERPQARVLATDRSAAALAVAGANARALGIGNVEFREGDWFAPLAGACFDLIASNPPYIAEGDAHLGRGDLRHEPAEALASGRDGLDAIRVIAAAAPRHLASGGWLLIEHGWDQGAAVAALLRAAGFAAVATIPDLEGRDRVTLGRRGGGDGAAC